MRMIFGVLGLLVVLAIVGSVAKKQLQAVKAIPSSLPAATSTVTTDGGAAAPSGDRAGRLDAFPGAVAADPNAMTVPQQSQNLQNQVKQDVNRALQQGAARGDGGQ